MANDIPWTFQERGKLLKKEEVIEWHIANFSMLPFEKDSCMMGPFPLFFDRQCILMLFPIRNTTLRVGLNFVGINDDNIIITVCLKFVDGTEKQLKLTMCGFKRKNQYTSLYACSIFEVMEQSSVLLPDDVLTIQCTFKRKETYPVQGTLFQRFRNVSLATFRLWKLGKRSDVVFEVGGRKFEAHKVILESRSEFFEAMFRHDTTENKTSEVRMEDVEADVFEQVLHYIYSGCTMYTSTECLFKLYMAADKYLLKELKHLCRTGLEQNLSVDTFCDFLAIADTYNEQEVQELMKFIKEFFTKNSISILDSEMWQNFVSENHPVVVQLLAPTVKENALKSEKKEE